FYGHQSSAALGWNGASWQTEALPASVVSLGGVTCTSPSFCEAVGDQVSGAVAVLTTLRPPPLPTSCTQGFFLGQGTGVVPATSGYWAVSRAGAISSCSGAPLVNPAPIPSGAIVSATTSTPGGGLLVTTDAGGVYAYAGARYYGSLSALPASVQPGSPVVGIASAPDGRGYWQVTADGSVYSFGDAQFHGSMGGHALAAPVVGIAADPATGGYWLVGSDGGVFAFDA
ncbi:MAG: hypothetical protein ACYCTL_03460, partial [Acidimicrobiales bacterium]